MWENHKYFEMILELFLIFLYIIIIIIIIIKYKLG
jgi:hypothetical protein